MIIDSNRHPEKNIYFIRAKLLENIKTKQFSEFDINALYVEYNKKNLVSVSFDYFLLTLDWLFILKFIKVNKKGNIVLCI